jgi:hypothetical protein
MVFSLFTSGILLSYNTYILFLGIVRRNVYHNDRGGYVSSRHVCLPLATYSKPESLTLVRLAVNLGFAAGPALEVDHHEWATADYSG